MHDIVIAVPEPDMGETNKLIALANSLEIVDEESFEFSREVRDRLKRGDDAIVGVLAESKRAAYGAHRTICNTEASLRNPGLEADKIVKSKQDAYAAECRRIAAEAQAKAMAEAKRIAEEQALAEAAALEKAGKRAEAERRIQNVQPLQVVAVAQPKPKGSRTLWSAEVHDLKALAAAVGSGAVPLAAIQPDQTWLNNCASKMHDQLRWPGVRVVSRESVSR